MIYRRFEALNQDVSLLSLGTVKFGRNTGVKYPDSFALPDDRAVHTLLSRAEDLGINLLDTAPAYGESEARIGRALNNRERWILCTKVGEVFADGGSTYDFSGPATTRSITSSLQRLHTDHLDVVLIHSDGNDLAILEHSDCLETLQALRAKGMIRAVGMSHKTVAGGMRALALGVDVLMTELNDANQAQLPVLSQAAAAGSAVFVKKALGSGWRGRDSLRFVAAQPEVTSIVVGTLSPVHLGDNATTVCDTAGKSAGGSAGGTTS